VSVDGAEKQLLRSQNVDIAKRKRVTLQAYLEREVAKLVMLILSVYDCCRRIIMPPAPRM
jgi:hypothetical protein